MTQKFRTSQYKPVEGLIVRVVDNDEVLTLDYTGSMNHHRRNLWWGSAVGFRAMQVAAKALSGDYLWNREHLIVVSGHPGPGVLDSVNYVTASRDKQRLTVMENVNCKTRCNSEMKFEWWVSTPETTAHVMLREDFVPLEFYQLVDTRMNDGETPENDRLFEQYKVNLSARIWNESLDNSFSVAFTEPLQVGEVPSNHEWTTPLKIATA